MEFWFRIFDLDDDGILTVWEMEQFWEEQSNRMKDLYMESIKFEDCVCQM